MSHRPSRSRSRRRAHGQPPSARSNRSLVCRVIATHQLAAPRHRRRFVVRLLEQRVDDVLDLAATSRCAAPPQERDVVEEDLRARRARPSGRGTRRTRPPLAATARCARFAAAICWPSVPSANSRNAQPRPCARSRGGHAVGVGVQDRRRLLRCTGSAATSHSKSVIVRNVGTTLRDSMIIASGRAGTALEVRGLGFLVGGVTPATRRRSRNAWIAWVASGLAERERVVGRIGSSTISPPLDQMNGASADDLGVHAEPVLVDRAVAVGVLRELGRCLDHVDPGPVLGAGSSTPACSNRSRCSRRPGSRRSAACRSARRRPGTPPSPRGRSPRPRTRRTTAGRRSSGSIAPLASNCP